MSDSVPVAPETPAAAQTQLPAADAATTAEVASPPTNDDSAPAQRPNRVFNKSKGKPPPPVTTVANLPHVQVDQRSSP
ncbi:hypothetical protein BASA81_003936 [Batrachochytrium salamandrivorans]|nr:hypothetical protein BASA81_003936 [Batrachochytrium salamandrivorans]